MVEPPKPGELAKVTVPPQHEIRIVSVGPRRGSGPEWVVVDAGGARWAVVPRTDGPDGARWYAASLVESDLDAMMRKDEAFMTADLARLEPTMRRELDKIEREL